MMPKSTCPTYSVDDDQFREQRLIEVLMQSSYTMLTDGLGLSRAWWSIIGFRKEHYGREGDIDILFGNLIVTEDGEIDWPPSTEYLVACEVKSIYRMRHTDNEPHIKFKSTKNSTKKRLGIQSQLRQHIRDGFDRVVLVDIVSNPPETDVEGHHPWMVASSLSGESLISANESVLNSRFQEVDCRNPIDSVGHFAISNCPINGCDEVLAGASSGAWLKQPKQNMEDKEKRHAKRAIKDLFQKTDKTIHYNAIFKEEHGELKYFPSDCIFSTAFFRAVMEPKGDP